MPAYRNVSDEVELISNHTASVPERRLPIELSDDEAQGADADLQLALRLSKELQQSEARSGESSTGSSSRAPPIDLTGARPSSTAVGKRRAEPGSPTSVNLTTAPDEGLDELRTVIFPSLTCPQCSREHKMSKELHLNLSVFYAFEDIKPFLLSRATTSQCPSRSCTTVICVGCQSVLEDDSATTTRGHIPCSCAGVRLVLLFHALAALDEERSRQGAASAQMKKGHSRASSIGSGVGFSSKSVTPKPALWKSLRQKGKGRGKAPGQSTMDSGPMLLKTDASLEETRLVNILRLIAWLLPHPEDETATVGDWMPHAKLNMLLKCSGLPSYLEELLRNDSFTDIVGRGDLYFACLEVLHTLSSSEATLDLLTHSRCGRKSEPGLHHWALHGVHLEWLELDEAARSSSSGSRQKKKAKTTEHREPLVEHLTKLVKQGQIFATSMQNFEADDGDDEAVIAISLAGGLISHAEQIERAVERVGSSVPAPVVEEEECLVVTSSSRRSTRVSQQKKKETVFDLVQETEKQYAKEAAELAFDQISMGDNVQISNNMHKFAGQVNSMAQSRGKKNVLRIAREVASMATGLPPGIFVRVDESRSDTLKALIMGPVSTPYSLGLFAFDLYLPQGYPEVPPVCEIVTTGGGRVRFNPNLYNSGKVCLSLLGTWSGSPEEMWKPWESTIAQVLISIQALILNDVPWENEPGQRRPAQPELDRYNGGISLQTAKFAMTEWLQPSVLQNSVWRDVIKMHFRVRGEAVRAQLEEWNEKGIGIKSWTAASTSQCGRMFPWEGTSDELPQEGDNTQGSEDLLQMYNMRQALLAG